MIRSHGRRNQHGEPTVTFKAEGVHDVMRWAIHQLSGQSEFCEVGTKTLRSLRRQIGSLAFDSYLARLCGGTRDSDDFKRIRSYSIKQHGGV